MCCSYDEVRLFRYSVAVHASTTMKHGWFVETLSSTVDVRISLKWYHLPYAIHVSTVSQWSDKVNGGMTTCRNDHSTSRFTTQWRRHNRTWRVTKKVCIEILLITSRAIAPLICLISSLEFFGGKYGGYN